MRTSFAAALLLALLTLSPALGAPKPAPKPVQSLRAAPLTPTVMRSLDRFELHLKLRPYANPYDPDQILVQGRFLSPSGRSVTVDGFFFEDFTRSQHDGKEVLTPRGAPEWRIRFTPTEVGTWAYTVSARDAGGERVSVQKSFRVLPPLPEERGFVRTLGYYFAFTDGTPFFPVGENLAWAGADGTFSYDAWLRQLGRQKASYARIWVGPFDLFTLERKRGRYDQQSAWRLDYVLGLARKTGVRLSLCAESFNALRIRPGPALWKDNPYNVRNGGFLRRPADFFTDAEAKKAFKNRLRYLAARYGWSPYVMSWELMNEVDLTEDYNADRSKEWHVEMARALRSFDPYAHPITTSFGTTEGSPAIDALPEIDYVQTHLYGAGDIALALAEQCRFKRSKYAKPNLVSEAGASVHRAVNERDDSGIWVHDALWAPAFNGAAGTGMPWWWDSYVDVRGLYDEFGAVQRFTADIPWTSYDWKAPKVVLARYQDDPRIVRNDLLIAPPQAGWQIAPYNRPVTIEVLKDGTVRDPVKLSRVLHGATRRDLHNPATFIVDYPVDGQFVVHLIDPPTAGSVLRVSVDGRAALDEPFGGGDSSAPRRYAVDVGAGQHTVSVTNAGSGWLDVNYELPGYRRGALPNLRVSGMCTDRWAALWVENRDHTWLRRALGKAVRPVPPSLVVLDGFQIGDYVLEEWNTSTGTSIPHDVRCVDGHITLHVPQLTSDIAYKLHHR